MAALLMRASPPNPAPAAPAASWTAALRRATDAVLYSSTWLALAALGLTWSTCLLWRQPLPPRLGALVLAATLFLYNLDSVLPFKYQPHLVLSGRKQWMLQHRRELFAVALAALAVAATLFFLDHWQVRTLFLGHLAVISLLYSLPVAKVRGRWRALREVPLLKVFLIAYVWAAVTVWLPALHLGRPLAEPAVALLFVRRFLFILGLAFVFDIRDYAKDRLTGTRTFPVVLGVPATKRVALAVLAFSCLLVWPGLTAPQWLALLLPPALGATLVWHAHERRPDYYFALLTDGVMLVQFLAVAAVEW